MKSLRGASIALRKTFSVLFLYLNCHIKNKWVKATWMFMGDCWINSYLSFEFWSNRASLELETL